jgi:S1-C subfamily serine protease
MGLRVLGPRCGRGHRQRLALAVRTGVTAAALAGCGGAGPGAAAAPATATPAKAMATPATATAPPGNNAVGGAAALQQAFVSVIRRTLPSVVEITTNDGLGSGVVMDTAGHIVTNAHVVGSATTFRVTLSGSTKSLPATLVGTYPPDDLAVIKVDGATSLRPATFADSSKLQVGDVVLAMGNPLGLSSSVTEGIVSAIGRTVSEPSGGGSPAATLPDVVQTSAPINPGNSGGALVGLDGRVAGIPTLGALDQDEGGAAAAGIGFAIPANIVTNIAGQLVKSGKVTDSHRAAVGARVLTVAGADGQPVGVGIVDVTAGGPAARAGLGEGAIVTAVNGSPTPDTEALSTVLAGLRPGQRVPVAVTTADGTKKTVTVVLGEL